MGTLLILVFIFIFIFYLIKIFGKIWLRKFLLKHGLNIDNMQNFTNQEQREEGSINIDYTKSKKTEKKVDKSKGEYVDFEEI